MKQASHFRDSVDERLPLYPPDIIEDINTVFGGTLQEGTLNSLSKTPHHTHVIVSPSQI
jgi:hypothetical protein